MLGGCGDGKPDGKGIADPPHAFYPYETVILRKSVQWAGLRIDVDSVGGSVGKDIRDVDVAVHVVYVNGGAEYLRPPTDVRFEFGFHPYLAAPAGQIKLPGGRFV